MLYKDSDGNTFFYSAPLPTNEIKYATKVHSDKFPTDVTRCQPIVTSIGRKHVRLQVSVVTKYSDGTSDLTFEDHDINLHSALHT